MESGVTFSIDNWSNAAFAVILPSISGFGLVLIFVDKILSPPPSLAVIPVTALGAGIGWLASYRLVYFAKRLYQPCEPFSPAIIKQNFLAKRLGQILTAAYAIIFPIGAKLTREDSTSTLPFGLSCSFIALCCLFTSWLLKHIFSGITISNS